MTAKRVLALNISGNMTYCVCPPELRGKGRCNHVEHQRDGESPQEFISRVESVQERLLSGMPYDEAEESTDKPFIPYEGSTVETMPYRMTDQEREGLVKIENRMQLDQNIEGGYMELEEPLWNDMDKNYYCQISGMQRKSLNDILHGDAFMITESNSGRFKSGRIIKASQLDEWKQSGYPDGWDDSIKLETGVAFMNKYVKQNGNFEATRYVYVLPYYMRMGVADHTHESSASEGGEAQDLESMMVSSDITIGYKYMLRQHANADKQQLAYDALLNNSALQEHHARFSNGYRNASLAEEFAGKGGVFRAVLSGSSIPYSGRAKIVPNADLKFGEVAIPASMAIDIYRPTLLKQLSVEGKSMEEIDQWMGQFRIPQHQIGADARRDLDARIKNLRIAMNRQPSLHQSSFQSYHPRVSNSAAAEIHPLYCKAYNADFDGDECSFYGFNNAEIYPVLDRSIDASLPINIRLPRSHDTLSIMPSKDAMFGLLSILEQRTDSNVKNG